VRVLLTNDAMVNLAGSELVTYTLAVMLRRAGHTPMVFTLNHGRVSEVLRKDGIPVVLDLHRWKDVKFDVAHVHHNTCAAKMRRVFPKLPAVFVSHGVLPELERPPPKKIGIAVHVAVSEEVQARFSRNFGIKRTPVMRNAVDTGRFCPTVQPSYELKKVLVVSNHFPMSSRRTLKEACTTVGAELRIVGMNTKVGPVWNMPRLYNEADLVITLGRGVLEAMACCRAVLVWDVHGGDDLVTSESYPAIRRFNFSGRCRANVYTKDDLVELLRCYHPSMGSMNRRLVLKHHDVERQVWEWERVYAWAVERGVPKC